MTLGPLPTRFVGFIEMDPGSSSPNRWEALAGNADSCVTFDAPLAGESCSLHQSRCRSTRLLADLSRLCDELQAEYESMLREIQD